jgi:hypothetical protein
MNPKCIQAVNDAAGKPVSAGKLKAIEKELVKKSRELARIDASLPPNQRKWASMSRDERTIAAAEAAMKDMLAEAARKEANAFKQILATNRIDQFVTQRMAEKNTTRSRGFIKFLDLVDAQVGAVRDQYFGQLSDLLEAVTIRDGVGLARNLGMRLFDLDNTGMTKDVVKEIWKNADGHTGNAAAKKAAEAWLKTIEDMRVRFNSAGGNVGKLGYGYLTQIHDSSKIRAAQPQKWGDFVMDRLDRSQYLREDGSRMDDAEVRAIVDQSYETLKNDGFDPDKAGAFRGTGAKANAGSESRVLHFRDGEAWMEYMAEFGRGSLYDAMMGHVSGMARNIALVEAMGPNPAQAAWVQFDLGSKDKEAGIGMGGREWFTTPEQRWKIISGESGMPDNEKLANIGSGLRLVQTASLLGSAVMSSVTDLGTVRAGIHYNKLSYMQFLANWRKTAWEEAKGIAGGRKYLQQELQTHGIIVDSLIDELNRWVGDNMAGNAPGRAAGAVMKLSLMNAWTDSVRRAYRMTLENASAELVKKDWEKLTEWDRNRFSELGVTKEDWAVLSKVTPEKIGGRDYITADAVMKLADSETLASTRGDTDIIVGRLKQQTAELQARNIQDQDWIKGRLDKFDDVRDKMNRAIKQRAAKKIGEADEAGDALRARIELLDARKDEAKLLSDMEGEFNKLATKDDIAGFLSEVRAATREATSDASQSVKDARRIGLTFGARRQKLEAALREYQTAAANGEMATGTALRGMTKKQYELEQAKLEADIGDELVKLSSQDARDALREAINDGAQGLRRDVGAAMRSAEAIGRRYGEQKGKLERQVRELENRIGELGRKADREINEEAKAVQKRADEMLKDLAEYIKRSQERQARRQYVIDRLTAEEAPAIAAEANRIRRDVAKRWAAAMASESDFGVINPDVASRALVTWGGEKAGTPKGELARMSTQFLSFPTAMITRHWGRVFDTPQGLEGAPMGYRGAEFAQKAGLSQGQAEYLAKFGSLTAFSLSLALLGGIAMQIKALAAGKDPMDMNPENDEGARFWLRAMAQGGGLSYFGNLIFAPQESLPGGVMEKTMGVMAGPVGGMVGGMGDLTIGNLQQLAAGEETDAAAELLRWTNRNLPGQSLWQIRTLWQRNVIEQGQESVNPGFLARMKRRAQKDGTSWWWEPGDRLPERAPDPSTAWEQ